MSRKQWDSLIGDLEEGNVLIGGDIDGIQWAGSRITELETQLAQPKPVTCKLWLEDSYEDQWRSECGRDWYFTEGGPYKNNLNYCASCGKRLEVVEGKGGE